MDNSNYEYELAHVKTKTAEEAQEFNLFAILKPSIQRDGNQWCVLYGEDLQVGIAGFGDSPHLAIMDFNSQWYKSII